ncbi:MAG: hypothetical protein HYU32_11170, partial [candidate division NC10 bacterium]|nr:hypothetical protein [candidate division NC10 bacterium]
MARTLVSPRHLVLTVMLVVALVAVYMLLEARRTQRELERELRDRTTALMRVLESSARNAIAGNALVEELIGQRLLDNASLIDRLLASTGLDGSQVDQIVTRNRLRKVEFLDRAGGALGGPPVVRSEARGPAPPGRIASKATDMMGPAMGQRMREEMGRMMGWSERGAGHEGWPMPFMWGWRWREPPASSSQAPALPPAVKERRFWEGSDYGVAFPATSFPGIIAVHADARILLEFRDQVGMQRLLEEIGRQPDIAYVALLDVSGRVMAHSDPSRVGTRETGGGPATPAGDDGPSRRPAPASSDIYEVSRAFPLGKDRAGLLRLGFSVAPIQAAWAQDQRKMVIYSGTVLLVGVLGVLAIFLNQRRYLR